MNQSATIPDNLKSRLSRVYAASREFTDDSGKIVKFTRLVLVASVKNEPIEIELKVDKRDLMLLGLADVVESENKF